MHPSSLAAAAQGAEPDDREALGLPAPTPPAGFAWQVLGVCRAILPLDACASDLRPASARASSDPLLCVAVGAADPRTEANDRCDVAASVRASLEAMAVSALPEVGGPAAGDETGVALAGGAGSVLDAAAVVPADAAPGPRLSSPLQWFACAPEAAGSGDAAPSPAREELGDPPAETAVSVVRPEAFSRGAVGHILARLDAAHLDLAALRLVFPSRAHLDRLRAFSPVPAGPAAPLLVLAARGLDAARAWSHIIGPEDPAVARRTDPASLRARFGIDRARNLLSCARSAERSRREAAFWFSLSLAQDMAVGATHPAARLPSLRLLCAFPVETTAAVLRPGLPAHTVAAVLDCYLRSGLRLTGLRRSPLEPRAVEAAGLPAWAAARGVSPPPVCVLLRGENAVARVLSLEREVGTALAESGGLPGSDEIGPAPSVPKTPQRRAGGAPAFAVHASLVCAAATEPAALRCAMHLAIAEETEPVDSVAFAQRVADAPARLATPPELPQVACVVLTPDCATDSAAVRALFTRLLRRSGGGLGADLLGCKLLAWLPPHATRELCPVAKGQVAQYEEATEALGAGPVLALAVRLPDAYSRLAALLGPLPGTPEAALARNAHAGRPPPFVSPRPLSCLCAA